MNEELQRINLDDYVQTGEGGNGKTYVKPAVPGEILKVNNARISTETILFVTEDHGVGSAKVRKKHIHKKKTAIN